MPGFEPDGRCRLVGEDLRMIEPLAPLAGSVEEHDDPIGQAVGGDDLAHENSSARRQVGRCRTPARRGATISHPSRRHIIIPSKITTNKKIYTFLL